MPLPAQKGWEKLACSLDGSQTAPGMELLRPRHSQHGHRAPGIAVPAAPRGCPQPCHRSQGWFSDLFSAGLVVRMDCEELQGLWLIISARPEAESLLFGALKLPSSLPQRGFQAHVHHPAPFWGSSALSRHCKTPGTVPPTPGSADGDRFLPSKRHPIAPFLLSPCQGEQLLFSLPFLKSFHVFRRAGQARKDFISYLCVCFGACISSAALRAFWGSSFTSFCLDLLPPPWGRAGDPEPLWGLPFWGPRLASEPSRCQIPNGVVQERAGSWRLPLSSPKSHGLSHARSHPGLLPELVPTLGELGWVSGTSWRSQQWSGEKKKRDF